MSSITPCYGSWDGPNETACEILGKAGVIGDQTDFSTFVFENQIYSNTGRRDSININLESDGSLTFTNSYSKYNSFLHPVQFAYWKNSEDRFIVGIEDLDGTESIGSDWDYNDLIVSFSREEYTPVPEAGSFSLLLLSLVFFILFKKVIKV